METMIETMLHKAVKILPLAYAPYSNFSVASCICTEQNEFFVGVNVENSSYGLSVCAETSAICQMVAAGHQRIKAMVILASSNQLCSPCGGCRQRIREFSTSDTMIYLCNKDTVLQKFSMDELLPMAFTLTSSSGK
jgi:cytidine deaminase